MYASKRNKHVCWKPLPGRNVPKSKRWLRSKGTGIFKTTKYRVFVARKRSLRRLCFYRCLSVHRGGACMAGGCMHGRGYAWQGGMHGRGMCGGGGHVWWWRACVTGGVHGRGGMCGGGHVCHICPPSRYYGIRSMIGRYASYWNAFLLITYTVYFRRFA